MAITQDRMISLITAARQCKDCALIYQRFITTEIKHLPAKPTLDEALSLIRAIQSLALTNSIPMEAGEILAREEEHFRLMATRNKRSAAYARKRRASPSSTPSASPELQGRKSPSAPLTLDRFRHADLQTVVQPHPSHPNQTQHQPAAWTETDRLVQNKIKINQLHADLKMKEPYSPDDIWDDSIPLDPDHYEFLGLQRPAEHDSLF